MNVYRSVVFFSSLSLSRWWHFCWTSEMPLLHSQSWYHFQLKIGKPFLKIHLSFQGSGHTSDASGLKAGAIIPFQTINGKFQGPINKPGDTIKFIFSYKVGLAWKVVRNQRKLWKGCLIILSILVLLREIFFCFFFFCIFAKFTYINHNSWYLKDKKMNMWVPLTCPRSNNSPAPYPARWFHSNFSKQDYLPTSPLHRSYGGSGEFFFFFLQGSCSYK